MSRRGRGRNTGRATSVAATAPAPARSTVVEVEAGYPPIGWRDELAAIQAKRAQLRKRETELVAQALAAGATLSGVARALGVSRQAAHRRYGRLRPVVTEPAGSRVQA